MRGLTHEDSSVLLYVFLQHERLKSEFAEEIARLRRDVERSKEEAQGLALKAETARLQAEEETKQQTLKLSEQLQEMQRKQEVEVCVQGNFNHYKPYTYWMVDISLL